MQRIAFGIVVATLYMGLGWSAALAEPVFTRTPAPIQARESAGTTDSAYDRLAVQLPAISRLANQREQMSEQIREFQRLFDQKRYSQAKSVLKVLKQLQLDLGDVNIFAIAHLLMRAADQAAQQGNTKEAELMYREAGEFAPDLAEPHYRLAWFILRTSPLNAYHATKSLIHGFKRHSRDIFGLSVLIVNAMRYLAWCLGIAFLLFWIILLLRSLRLFQSDFRDLFPHGVTSFQIQLLSLFLLFLPLLMGAGLLETLLCWILISWFYQTKGERILTTCGLLLLSAAPYAADWAGKLTALSRSPLASIYLLNRSEMRDKAARRLEALAKKKGRYQKDGALLWSLGLHFKRKGDMQAARMYYRQAMRYKKEPALAINLANIDLLGLQPDKAYRAYQKALQRRGVPEGQYNLSLIYQYSASTDTAVVGQKVHALTAARAGGGERIERFIRQTKPQINRFVMDVALPQQYYLKGLLQLPENAVLKQQLWTYAATWIPLSMSPWVGLLMIALLWLLLPFGGRFFCGQPCLKCGDVIGRREQKGNDKEEQCTQCLQMSGKKDGISAERRVKKELEIQRYRRRRSYLLMAFSVACLGAGQLLLRESARGFFLLLLFATTLFMWLLQPPLLVHPLGLGSPVSLVWQIVWTALALMLYIRAVRDVYWER